MVNVVHEQLVRNLFKKIRVSWLKLSKMNVFWLFQSVADIKSQRWSRCLPCFATLFNLPRFLLDFPLFDNKFDEIVENYMLESLKYIIEGMNICAVLQEFKFMVMPSAVDWFILLLFSSAKFEKIFFLIWEVCTIFMKVQELDVKFCDCWWFDFWTCFIMQLEYLIREQRDHRWNREHLRRLLDVRANFWSLRMI